MRSIIFLNIQYEIDLSNENLMKMVEEVDFFRQFENDPVFQALSKNLKSKTTSNSLGGIPKLDEHNENMKVFNAKMLE